MAAANKARALLTDTGAYCSLQSLVAQKYQAKGFSLRPRGAIHSVVAGQKPSKMRGRGTDFEELRVYQRGDDIRSIDWKVTARTGETHTRVYNEERDRPVWLVIDQRQSMFFGSQRAMKSVLAAEAAALAAWRVIDVGDRVAAVVFNDQRCELFPPLRSSARVMQILAAVVEQNHKLKANTEVKDHPSQINVALQRVASAAPHDTLVVVISDLSGADDTSRQWIDQIAQRNDLLIAHVSDPLEGELPPSGTWVVGDSRLQLSIDASDLALRTAYAGAFQQRLETIKTVLQQRQVPVIALQTPRGAADQLRDALGAAQRRQRARPAQTRAT
ncbi:DUF58 domain-containing protein [Gammaproteobacteria bacterium]|nr:DUF58 domain-containing protein [Gammaproteobacteria bacterium]